MKASVITQRRRDYDLGWREAQALPRTRRRLIYELTTYGKQGEQRLHPSWDVRTSMRLSAIWLGLDPEIRALVETLLVVFALVLFGLVGLDIMRGWSAP